MKKTLLLLTTVALLSNCSDSDNDSDNKLAGDVSLDKFRFVSSNKQVRRHLTPHSKEISNYLQNKLEKSSD